MLSGDEAPAYTKRDAATGLQTDGATDTDGDGEPFTRHGR